jgi:hypothetical protein
MSNAVQAQKDRNPEGQIPASAKPLSAWSLGPSCQCQMFLSKQVLGPILHKSPVKMWVRDSGSTILQLHDFL